MSFKPLSTGLIILLAVLSTPAEANTNKPAPKRTQEQPSVDSPPSEWQWLRQQQAQHPELQAAKQQWQAAQARIRAASALPDPQLTGGVRNVGVNTFTLGQEAMSGVSVMLQQNYPAPQKLRLKELLAYRETRRLEQLWHLKQRELRLQLAQVYLQWIESQQALKINGEMQQLLEPVQRTAEAYFKLGKVRQEDVWRVKTERSRLENRALELQRQLQTRRVQIWRLLGASAAHSANAKLVGQTFPQPRSGQIPSRTELASHLDQHPRLRGQEEALVKADLQRQLSRAQEEPDFLLAGGLTQRLSLDPLWEIKGGMTLPIYGQEKIQPEIKARQFQYQAQLQEVENTRQELAAKLDENWILATETQRQQALYHQQLLPEARLTFDASLASYTVGQSDMLRVLQSLASLLQVRREDLSLKRQYLQALSQLEYLSGETLI